MSLSYLNPTILFSLAAHPNTSIGSIVDFSGSKDLYRWNVPAIPPTSFDYFYPCTNHSFMANWMITTHNQLPSHVLFLFTSSLLSLQTLQDP